MAEGRRWTGLGGTGEVLGLADQDPWSFSSCYLRGGDLLCGKYQLGSPSEREEASGGWDSLFFPLVTGSGKEPDCIRQGLRGWSQTAG